MINDKDIKNMGKYNNIKDMINSNSKAIKNGFYYESVVILYNLIDDRLDSILIRLKVCKKTTKENHNTLHRCGQKWTALRKELVDENKKQQFNLKNISTKIHILKMIIKKSEILINSEHPYLIALGKMFSHIKFSTMNETLLKTDEWRIGRNELIHNMLLKPYQENDIKAKHLAEEGMNLFRDLDSFTKKVERMMDKCLVKEYQKMEKLKK